MLSKAYKSKQDDSKVFSVFVSSFDILLHHAKSLAAELLPNKMSVDRHLRLNFWEGLRGRIVVKLLRPLFRQQDMEKKNP